MVFYLEAPKIEDDNEIQEYQYRTLVELKNVAKEKGLKGYSKMKKDELIMLLQ